MTNQHPITPPPELVQQWINEEDGLTAGHIATQAAQWGADQELEACCKCLTLLGCSGTAAEVRADRRPKPPSLKEQALADLDYLIPYLNNIGMGFKSTNLRRALEALPND
jgi:hypothetical protein